MGKSKKSSVDKTPVAQQVDTPIHSEKRKKEEKCVKTSITPSAKENGKTGKQQNTLKEVETKKTPISGNGSTKRKVEAEVDSNRKTKKPKNVKTVVSSSSSSDNKDSSDTDSDSSSTNIKAAVAKSDPKDSKSGSSDSSDSDSSSDESSSDSDNAVVSVSKVKKSSEGVQNANDSSSSSSSDDSSDESSDEKKEKVTKKDEKDDASSSSDEDVKEPKKKEGGSDTDSSDSSEESDAESDTPVKVPHSEQKPKKVAEKSKSESFEKVTNQDEKMEMFIGGLPWSMSEEDIKECVEEFVNQEGCTGRIHLLKDDMQRSKGAAFVSFNTQDAFEAGLKMDGIEVQGRTVKANSAANKPSGGNSQRGSSPSSARSSSVFIGNLPFTMDEDRLREEFGDCGEICSARIATDRETGKPRGFAHIDFADERAAEKATKKNGIDVDGRTLKVDFAGEKSSQGDRQSGGRGSQRGSSGGRGFGGRGGDSGGRGGRGRGGGRSSPSASSRGNIQQFSGRKQTFDDSD